MKMKIGDITEIIDGDRGKNYPKKSDFKDEGFCLFLNTGNVTSDGFVFKKNDFISEEKSNKLRKGKLERGDLVFTTRGTVGNVAYYSDNIPYDHVRINSGMVIFRVFEKKVFNKFLYQILKHKNSRIYIRQYCTGSAQPQLPIMNLRNIELNIPPLETQYKIARILLAYDDLIENNERQLNFSKKQPGGFTRSGLWICIFRDMRMWRLSPVYLRDGNGHLFLMLLIILEAVRILLSNWLNKVE